MVVRRAAVDIGSGCTKLLVADVEGRRITRVVVGKVVSVPYGDDFHRNGRLSGEIVSRGLRVAEEFAAAMRDSGVPAGATAAVATEVFRSAAEGGAVLQKLSDVLRCQVKLVPQEEEALLGLRTATALLPDAVPDTVVWDSGGGSFQIAQEADGELRTYTARIGYAAAAAELRRLQGRSSDDEASPNPVSEADAEALQQEFCRRVPVPPSWLLGAKQVVGIGDDMDFFHIVSQVLGEPAAGPEGMQVCSYPASAAAVAYSACVGKTDDEILAAYPLVRREEVKFIVPKLALMRAVIEACGFDHLRALLVTGCCAGVVASQKYFAAL